MRLEISEAAALPIIDYKELWGNAAASESSNLSINNDHLAIYNCGLYSYGLYTYGLGNF